MLIGTLYCKAMDVCGKGKTVVMKTIIDSRSRVNNIFKPWFQRMRYRYQEKKIIFIFGCQRSGTTLLTHVFDRMPYSCVFGEYSPLSSKDPYQLRLNHLDEVKAIIDSSPAPLIVCKPLVESQRALEILEYFDNAQAIWLYRDYMDVASSNLVKFGPDEGARENIRPICDSEFANSASKNWLADNVSIESQKMIEQCYHPSMNPADAAALFWYLRNEHYFTQQLDTHPRVHLLKYEQLVSQPSESLARLFELMDIPFSLPQNIIKDVHTESVRKGETLELSPNVSVLANKMLDRLLGISQETNKIAS